MDESESKTEEPKKEQRLDPELLKEGLRYDSDQYEMLQRCSDKKDMAEWNEWRKENPGERVFLEEITIRYASPAEISNPKVFTSYIPGTSLPIKPFCLKKADLKEAYLCNGRLIGVDLEGADLTFADLEGADLWGANLVGAKCRNAKVSETTSLWECKVNRETDFRGVRLDAAKIDPGTKQLLEYNIRRKNWEDWYEKGAGWREILKRVFVWPFWLISDYGRSTGRIVITFFGFAGVFALGYWLWPTLVMVNGEVGDIRGFWHALYFSVVTMTTLGFGDIAANPDSWGGQTLLMFQVILGYVLMGALVTRFAVLFTAGGPAGTFADEESVATKPRRHRRGKFEMRSTKSETNTNDQNSK